MDRPVVPWIVSAVAVLIAIVSVVSGGFYEPPPVGPRDTGADEARAQELAGLRRKLISSESESTALRSELDRMRALLKMKQQGDERLAASGDDQLTPDQKKQKLVDGLARLDDLGAQLKSNPDQQTFEGFREVMMAMYNSPMDDPGLFIEKYRDSNDPAIKSFILPHLLARNGAGATEFVAEELRHTDDPALRATLINQLSAHADAAENPEAKQIFMAALDESDPDARARAVIELSSDPSPEIQSMLLETAINDSNEVTRETAIRSLAENPATRDRLLGAIANDPNDRLRKVGECAATLAAPR